MVFTMKKKNNLDPKNDILNIISELAEAESIIYCHVSQCYESDLGNGQYCWHVMFEQELKWLERSSLIKIISYDGEWITAKWTEYASSIVKDSEIHLLSVEDRLTFLLNQNPEISNELVNTIELVATIELAIAEIKLLRKDLSSAKESSHKYLQASLENAADVQKLILIGDQLAEALDDFEDGWRVLPKRAKKALENWKVATQNWKYAK